MNTNDPPVAVSGEDERQLEGLAMNIVFQIGDALYEALPPDVAHDHFVTARQATNDVAIDFTKRLIQIYGIDQRLDEDQYFADMAMLRLAAKQPGFPVGQLDISQRKDHNEAQKEGLQQ